MPVMTTCSACGASMVLGSRPFDTVTTVCPDCGATSYDTDGIVADERDRIRSLADATDGIGDETAAALADRMVTMRRLREARLSELRSVPGIGTKNGRALIDRLEAA